jgi:hypothetical protein
MKTDNILLAVILLFTPVFVSGQFQEAIGKKIEKKAKEKIEQRVDKKIDEGIDKGLDKVEDPDTYKKDKNSTENNTKSVDAAENNEQASVPNNIFKTGDKTNVLPEYTFEHNTLMEIESFDKKGKSNGKNNMRMLFQAEGEYFGGEIMVSDKSGEGKNSTGFSIFDWKNNQMIMLMDGEGMKMGMVMSMDATQSYIEEKAEANEKDVKYKKTGRTKTILGYLCEEYIIEDDESTSELWMTNEVDLNMAQAMGYMGQNQKGKKSSKTSYPKDAPQGFMMEMTSVTKKNNEKTTMKVTEVNKNKPTTVQTSGYKFFKQ